MPILARETELFPEDLLDSPDYSVEGRSWCLLYTLSRREKQLMRKLLALEVPFFGPTISRRYRSPNGRMRKSYQPLFPNYVFACMDESQRYVSLTTNCVSKCVPVFDSTELVSDLRRIRDLIQMGAQLSPESRLIAGDRIRVKTGVFAGFEGVVIHREGKVRLLVAVNFTAQGASFQLDECQLESIA